MTIATTADATMSYDVTFDAWVIDVKPTLVDAAHAVILDVNRCPGPSEAGGTRAAGDQHVLGRHQPTTAGEGGCQRMMPPAPAGCAVLPVRGALWSVRRGLRGRLACCTCRAATGPARTPLLIRCGRRRRTRGITVWEKKKPSMDEGGRCSQATQRDREEKLRDAISYCKMTMGITTGD